MQAKKIDFNQPIGNFKTINQGDIVEYDGKKYYLEQTWPATPEVELKKTSKSKGRPLTRAGTIDVRYDPYIDDKLSWHRSHDQLQKIMRFGALRLVDDQGIEWLASVKQPGYEITNAGILDPWTVYVAAYRQAKTDDPKGSSYKWKLAADKELWSKFKTIKVIDSQIKMEKRATNSEVVIENILADLDWKDDKRIHQTLEFFKDAKGVDLEKVMERVKSLTKTNRAIAKYAEKHPEDFAW